MKINVISDIHATYSMKTNEVLYHLPYAFGFKKYIAAIKQLYTYWNDNEQLLSKFEFKEKFAVISAFHTIKNYNQALSFLKEFYSNCENDFNGLTKDKMFDFSRKLTYIDNFMHAYGLKWKQSKTKLDIEYDLKNFMFKHLSDFDPTKLEPADYLIVAGDLGLDNTYDLVLADLEKKTAGKFKKILHIAGNHDHWWYRNERTDIKKPDSVNLSHDYYELLDGDYLFLGCTLWTPIPDECVWEIGRYMNDYNYTPGKFSPFASRNQYAIQSKWLKDKIEANKDKKIVVFTHHQPFEELTFEDYKHNGARFSSDNVNAAYVVLDHSLDDINKHGNIKLWCCGHTHQNYDGMLHGVHVVRNPIGYSDSYGYCPAENLSETWYNKIIEV